MAAPTTAACVKKTLANPEPSTHGPERQFAPQRTTAAIWGHADRSGRPLPSRDMRTAMATKRPGQQQAGGAWDRASRTEAWTTVNERERLRRDDLSRTDVGGGYVYDSQWRVRGLRDGRRSILQARRPCPKSGVLEQIPVRLQHNLRV
jgi:hypothetical protein